MHTVLKHTIEGQPLDPHGGKNSFAHICLWYTWKTRAGSYCVAFVSTPCQTGSTGAYLSEM